jgi:hypothetical protein
MSRAGECAPRLRLRMTPRIASQFPLEIYMKRSLTRIAAALVLTASMSACGTIMHGTSPDIGFQSSPSSAKLTVDGILEGQMSPIA